MLAWLRAGSARVTPDNATQIAVVLSCVRVLAESVAMLPLEVRAREATGTRPATELPLYRLLHDLPNPEMGSMDLRMTLMGHLAAWGNAYAQKVPDRAGRWVELWPLAPNRMKEPVRGADGALYYEYQEPSGQTRTFAGAEILHIRGLSSDGLMGLSPIAQARRSFERKRQMEQFEEAFWANGAQPGAVLKHPGKLSDKAFERLRESWEQRHMGPGNANRMAILEEGLDIASVGVPQSDAQFLESQKLTRAEIAGLFRVPSHMVNDLDRATFSNIEQMSLDFVLYTLMPWLVVWEQAINRGLLTEQQQGRYYAKHKVQALLRGDNASRAAFYSTGLQNGWMSINDVRELEDLNPIPNGNTYMVPLNMIPLDQAVKGPAATSAAAQASVRAYVDADHGEGCTCGQCRDGAVSRETRAAGEDPQEDLRVSRVEMARAMQPVLEDVATRITRREVRDVRRLAEKHLRTRSDAEFLAAVQELYQEFNGVVVEAFRAAILAYARQAMLAASAELGKKSPGLTDDMRQFVTEYLANLGAGWASSSRTQLQIVVDQAIADGVDPAVAVDERLNRWEETKASKAGDRQAFEALNALIIAAYTHHKITRIRWLASGASCPFCQQLSGKVVGIEQHFVSEGDTLSAGDAVPMVMSHNVRHGPLHSGCDCVTVAEVE